MYMHIPEIIRHRIESQPKMGRKYTFQVGKRDVVLYLVLPKPQMEHTHYSRLFHSKSQLTKQFDTYARRIAVWLMVAAQYGGAACAKQLTAYVLLTDHEKRLPKNGDINSIDTEHANTAFTTACSVNSEIFLYRAEEWFKVFIHETFHSLGIDFSQIDVAESNRQITRMFLGCDPHLDVRLYETYCEMWAEIINVLFLSDSRFLLKSFHTKRIRTKSSQLQKTRSKRDLATGGSIISRAEKYLQYERTFSMIQAGKVLRHNRMTYNDLCVGKPKYRELTPVFSYYVLKSILMYNLNEFIEWCADHTGSSSNTTTLSFPKSPESIREYGELIGRLYKSDEFIKTLEDSRIVQHGGMPATIIDTLRMTVFEA